ncbi:hypothetical protein JIN86_02635 [Lysinibacillus sp. HST-98]|jgi:hypothetical protein|uniref:Uncharacterized protein n=2 Tax=Lysinibacillus TaxID=400634 RepID=A0A2X1AC10_9BACI|nr:hypothetical protein LBYS11_14460 [Lysinibacillus sp. YS11]EFI67282.1 hypothetical protein BFZC1_16924 [Lysinibacillus fusiformis ZC1]EKU44497.1 hypothetical protein C518_0103 [Lysinibacillus fusiformis ZB2]KGR87821.1 hypothetical protein CD31_05245 [Lysinibacillus boronitolerans JCM 21713 = 10a = NBRC 103108]KMN39941.1 hypothetical protein VK91_09125 [Lysinibacillus sp. LK3]MBL3728501.1 hypothetical protein [Lysinibacillus sp. HST-98]MBX8943381.1 hypothetical protein [Lysinibacillus sp. K
MCQLLKNDRGAIFLIAIALLFFVTTFVLAYYMSYEMQYRTYDGLEKLNVRATINLLGQILSDSVES